MANRGVYWALIVWTVFMAMGILAAYSGIGRDCTGLVGAAFDTCRSDARGRGAIGLSLLAGLWFVVAAPLWMLYNRSRRRS